MAEWKRGDAVIVHAPGRWYDGMVGVVRRRGTETHRGIGHVYDVTVYPSRRVVTALPTELHARSGSERSRAPHPRTRAERLVIEKELARRRAAAHKQKRGALGLFAKEKH